MSCFLLPDAFDLSMVSFMSNKHDTVCCNPIIDYYIYLVDGE